MTDEKAAAEIAKALFTNGAGQRARRLVLEMHDGAKGGGWSEGPAADQIAKVLERLREKGERTMTDRPSGSELIEAERRRQVEVEGWTPGPWEVGGHPLDGGLWVTGPNKSANVICDLLPREGEGLSQRWTAEDVANADLIAAAPTLYDVLNRLSLHGKGEGGARDTEIAAALRLARGEAP